MSNITTHKKLIYLFCLIVHYQNCYSKKLTCESYNSLLREIYADRMMVNACPYSKRYCGRVLSARYYQSEVKERIMVKDITEIVQDWVYLSMYRYGYNVLVLGDATSLQVLRGFLDVTTLKRI